jgi:DNA-binding transcriptional LysR family regulator
MDWDDARIFLAVARHGSLRAAGRVLGLSQPTVGRRLSAFEAAFGGPALFDRLPEGLRLNAAGEALRGAAERLEEAALALERRRAAASPALCGTVRVSVGEWAASFLAGSLAGSSATLPPGITLELVESQETANLARREADLAVRHHPPESGGLYIAKLGIFACAVYRRRDGASTAWVTYTEEQAHYATARWVQRQLDETGGAVARLRHGDAARGHPRRRRARCAALLCRRRRSAARAIDPAHRRTRRGILGHRASRSASRRLRARGHRLDPPALPRAARAAGRPRRAGTLIRIFSCYTSFR